MLGHRVGIIALIIFMTALSEPALSNSYEVSGYGDNGHVYGEIDASSGSRDVSGSIYLENGDEVSFEGEWVGNGEVEGYDSEGNYYNLEVE